MDGSPNAQLYEHVASQLLLLLFSFSSLHFITQLLLYIVEIFAQVIVIYEYCKRLCWCTCLDLEIKFKEKKNTPKKLKRDNSSFDWTRVVRCEQSHVNIEHFNSLNHVKRLQMKFQMKRSDMNVFSGKRVDFNIG